MTYEEDEAQEHITTWIPPTRPWLKLEPITTAQEEVIWSLAARMGYKDLRGFHMFLRSVNWDYYDVLEAEYR